MATTENGGGGDLASMVSNGYEFVEERLPEVDSSMSPAELAREYGCGNQHMQNVCSQLAQQGVIERVGEGQYVAAAESGDGSEVPELPVEPTESGEVSEEDSEDPSADGEAPSEDPDTEGGEDDLSGRDAALVGASTAGAAAFPSALEKLDTRQTVALVAVIVVVVWLLTRDGSGSSSGAVDDGQEESGSGSAFEEAGGLMQ